MSDLIRVNLTSPALELIAVVLVGTLLVQTWRSRPQNSIARLPTPPCAEQVWGHERTVSTYSPGYAFRKWNEALGLTYRIKAALWAPDILVLSDPVAIAHILQKRIYNYHHSRVVRPRIARFLGKGLGWVEGESEHRRMKRLIAPSISAGMIKNRTADIQEAISRVTNDLVLYVESSDSTRCEVNALEWTNRATLNSIGRMAFDYDFEGGQSPDARAILDARRRGLSGIGKYANILTLMALRRFPFLNGLPIPALRAQGLVPKTIKADVAQELLKRSQVEDAVGHKGSDLLGDLINAYKEGTIPQAEIFEHITTIMISGQETTAQTLAFTLLELARNPSIQTRLREELLSSNTDPTYDDFETKLPYLDAVVKETLRMYPALPYMERIAMEKDVIPLGEPITLASGAKLQEIVVEPGQTVIIPIIAIHRQGSVWGDPDVFRPERYLSEMPSSEKLCSGWANTLAFSDGPRVCVGRRFALFQYKTVLSQFVRSFRICDCEAAISLKIASSLQPWVVGKEDGPCVPVGLELL